MIVEQARDRPNDEIGLRQSEFGPPRVPLLDRYRPRRECAVPNQLPLKVRNSKPLKVTGDRGRHSDNDVGTGKEGLDQKVAAPRAVDRIRRLFGDLHGNAGESSRHHCDGGPPKNRAMNDMRPKIADDLKCPAIPLRIENTEPGDADLVDRHSSFAHFAGQGSDGLCAHYPLLKASAIESAGKQEPPLLHPSP